MMVIGFGVGIWRATRISKKRGIEPERVYDIALVILLSSIVGARLIYILLNPDTESFRNFFAVWQGGLSFHGGALFAIIFGYAYTKFAKLPFWKCADLIVPSVAIGYAFTRIGCFLNGCCYGAPTDLPWGVRFLEQGMLTPPSHPTQIYAAFASLLIFFILTRFERLNRAPGFIFISYLGLYSIYRFLIEYLRAGFSAEMWMFGLTQAQGVSIAIFALWVAVVFIFYRKPVSKIS